MATNDDLPKRTVDELLQIHLLEANIATLVVEGESDRDLLEWFFWRSKLDVTVYFAGVLDLPAAPILAIGLEDNHRSRVVYVARQANAQLPAAARCYCLIDKDFDDLIGTDQSYPTLLRTDFTSMEMYALNDVVLAKFLKLQEPQLKEQPATVVGLLADPLKELFAIRLAKRLSGLAVASVQWHRSLTITPEKIEFDFSTYCMRMLHAAGKISEASKLQAARTLAVGMLAADVRHAAHGHDFVELFAWFLKKKKCGNRDSDEVKRQLYSAIDYSDLVSQPLFAAVLENYTLPAV